MSNYLCERRGIFLFLVVSAITRLVRYLQGVITCSWSPESRVNRGGLTLISMRTSAFHFCSINGLTYRIVIVEGIITYSITARAVLINNTYVNCEVNDFKTHVVFYNYFFH